MRAARQRAAAASRRELVATARVDAGTFLAHRSVQPRTAKLYQAGYLEVLAWHHRQGSKGVARRRPAARPDVVEGRGVAAARAAICGALFCLNKQWRGGTAFPLTERRLRGFRAVDRAKLRDPAPWAAVLAMAAALLGRGDNDALQAAACALLSFDLYLRPSEALLLRRRHVLAPPRGGHRNLRRWAVIVAPSTELRVTKTKQQDDTILLGVPGSGREWLAQVLQGLAQPRAPAELLFTLTLGKYEAQLRWAAAAAAVNPRFTPHALRHGGPSHDALHENLDLLAIQGRGRWAALTSVRRYEKHGRLLNQIGALPPAVREREAANRQALALQLPRQLRSLTR